MSVDDNSNNNNKIKLDGIIPAKTKEEQLENANPSLNTGQINVRSAENIPNTDSSSNQNQNQMIQIPMSMYNDLIAANDSAFITLMAVYEKFDAILGAVMNLQGFVFNKKEEVKKLTEFRKADQSLQRA